MATILVIDDDPGVRGLLGAMFRRKGHRLLEASDGVEGLRYIQATRPDLVITDLVMPKMSGFELARQIRKSPEISHTPVIFLTGVFGTEDVRKQAESCGVSRVVRKGLDPGMIVQVADEVLSSRPVAPPPAEPFDTEQVELYNNTLLAKVRELEQANQKLEQEIALRRRNEEALHISEAKYRAVFDHAAHGMFRSTPEGRFLEINMALAKIYGYESPAAALVQINNIADQIYVDPGVRGQFMQQVEKDGSVTGFEFQIRRSDGRIAWVREGARAVRDSSGKVVCYEGSVEDITEHKQGEAARRESEERFRRYFELGLVGMAVTSLDKGFVEVNNEICRILGYKREELLKKTWAEVTHPDDLASDVAQFNRLLAGEIDGYALDKRFIRKDGHVVHATISVTCLRRADGAADQVAALLQDITERKKAEESLRVSKARLRGIVDSAMDAVITIDESERIVLFNAGAEKMFGCGAADVLGQTLDRFIPERFRTLHTEHIRRFAKTGTTTRRMGELGTVYGLRADGTEFPVEASISQVQLPEGKQFTVILRDITERQRAEEELRQSNRRLQLLSRKVIEIQENERRHLAHELHDEIGQVLSAVSVNLKTVKTRLEAPSWPRIDESIAIVDRAIQQVRDLSLDLRPSMLDDFGLEAALRWYVNRVAERSGIAARFDAKTVAEAPYVVRNACFRVAQECLTNVVRHSRARNVEVSLDGREDEIRLEIADDGVGFDVGAARERAMRGGSLGVLGMQERVELLGGNIRIDSQPNQGTRVSVRLPLMDQSAEEK